MASSPLPILLGVGALLLLKGKAKSPTTTTPTTVPGTTPGPGTDSDASVGGGPVGGGGSTGGGTGSSGYKSVSASMMETIQKQLIQLQYDPGTADGQWRYGGSTYKAVKKFQADHGLEDDGKPGPLTRAKLNELTGSNSDDATAGADDPGGTSNDVDPVVTEDEIFFVPEPGPTQVAFNIAGTEYKLGSNFMSNYMEGRLNSARLGGWLATKSNDAPEYEDSGLEQTADFWMRSAMSSITGAGLTGGGVYGGLYVAAILVLHTTVSIPVSIAAGVAISASAAALAAMAVATWAGYNKEKWVKESGAYFVKKYVDQAHVIVGPNKTYTALGSVPRTDATTDFVAHVAEKVAYFQSSTYGD